MVVNIVTAGLQKAQGRIYCLLLASDFLFSAYFWFAFGFISPHICIVKLIISLSTGFILQKACCCEGVAQHVSV
jgi:hypothetical protein